MSAIDENIANRRFDLRSVRKVLDQLDYPELCQRLQAPDETTVFAKGSGHWTQGDGRPDLADDDPAIMAVIGRCAVNRARIAVTGVTFSAFHTSRCGYCDYPLDLLLAAIDWSIYQSRLITAQWWVWRQGVHPPESLVTYSRASSLAGTYQNPRYQSFHVKPIFEQREAVDRLQEASRVGLSERTSHEPWCRYEPDHGGECSTRTEEDSR